MNLSHPSVHPVEAPPPPPLTDGGDNNVPPPRVRMKIIQGMPATIGGLLLRFSQFIFAVFALTIMATTDDFPSVTAFCYLVAATGLQSLWSLSLAILDLHAILVGRCLQNYRVVSFFASGDGLYQTLYIFASSKEYGQVTSTLTFAAACASAGITVLIGNDLGLCSQNHCRQFETATAMAFLSWLTALPSFLFNFYTLTSR